MPPADRTGRIISHRNDRMGGRINAMQNAMRIARDYELPFFVGWTTGGRTSEEDRDPSMIVDADWVDAHFFDSDILGGIYSDLIDLSVLVGDERWTLAKFLETLASGERFLSARPWASPSYRGRTSPPACRTRWTTSNSARRCRT
jgi:hypothetical protein